jgi:hypothetical protein
MDNNGKRLVNPILFKEFAKDEKFWSRWELIIDNVPTLSQVKFLNQLEEARTSEAKLQPFNMDSVNDVPLFCTGSHSSLEFDGEMMPKIFEAWYTNRNV